MRCANGMLRGHVNHDVSLPCALNHVASACLAMGLMYGCASVGKDVRNASLNDLLATATELQQAIARHTWADFAGGLAAFFQRIVEMPEVATSAIGADSAAADAAQLSAILSSRTWRAAERLRRLKPGGKRPG